MLDFFTRTIVIRTTMLQIIVIAWVFRLIYLITPLVYRRLTTTCVISSKVELADQLNGRIRWMAISAGDTSRDLHLSATSKEHLTTFEERRLTCSFMLWVMRLKFEDTWFLCWRSQEARERLAYTYRILQELEDDVNTVEGEISNQLLAYYSLHPPSALLDALDDDALPNHNTQDEGEKETQATR